VNGAARYRAAMVVAMCVVLGAALAVVEYRSRNPEWKRFQQRGIDREVQRLEQQVAQEKDPAKAGHLIAHVDALKKRISEVIEIRPFNGKAPVERCMTCHEGIEDLSASHPNGVFGCVICHGGNATDLTVWGAHRGLRGGRNPATLELAATSCGSSATAVGACHTDRSHPLLNRADNVPKALMATNAGIIGILRFQWGIEDTSVSKFGIKPVTDGKTSLQQIPPERGPQGDFHLANSHFRKFCGSCHLWSARQAEETSRLAGCPACHATCEQDGKYRGRDPTINRDEPGHVAFHTITNRIPDDRCRACHNRSARVGLNYHGEMESDQYGTPFVMGGLNERTVGDGRFVLRLVPDIHHEKGMGCIDCHTGQDTMGDGVLHRYMKDQIEIRCEDCHGTHASPPRTMKVDRNDPLVQTLMRSSPSLKLADGDAIVQTSKGRPLPHVRLTDQGFRLSNKLAGKEHPVSVITGKEDGHRIRGHERLECESCHSAWSPQCYGCHQLLDLGNQGVDHLTGKSTEGRWAEGRSFFRFERNILGINSRGKVGILVPGCQVWNTVIDKHGKVRKPYDSQIMHLKNGRSSIAMGPTHPHTTRTEVPRCIDCHLDPKALGLGEGRLVVDPGTNELHVEPIYDSALSGLKIPFPLEAVVDSHGDILQGTSHLESRGFNEKEIAKIVGIAECLTCHDRYDDPVWAKPGPYTLTPACTKALEKFAK
jgi:hypothetical protein